MLRSYGELFAFPGTAAFSTTGLIARLPISQFNIAIILLISAVTSSYGLAGQIAGVAALAQAVVTPQIARLIDRYGQALVARPVFLVDMAAWCGFALVVARGGPQWSWFVLSAVGGACTVNVGAMVRARWVHLLPGFALQKRAFAWESVLDEIVFVVGPPLATFLATMIAPVAGVLVAAGFMLVGGLLFTAQRATEPPPSGRARSGGGRVWSLAFAAVAAVFYCCGMLFGAVDVIVVAFADSEGQRGMAGILLAALAAGSLVSGLVFGVITPPRSVGAQFVVLSCVPAVLMPTLLLAGNLWQLGVLMFVCGFAIAPILITATTLVQRLVPAAALTEGLTWTTTALVVGVTVGAAGGGQLADSFGPHQAFWLSSTAAWAAALTAVTASPRLRTAAIERAAGRHVPS